MEGLSKEQQHAITNLINAIDEHNEIKLIDLVTTTDQAFTSQLRTIISEETQQHDTCYMIELVQKRIHAIVPVLQEFQQQFKPFMKQQAV